MDFSKFTLKSQEAIERAQQLVISNGQQSIENAHLLKGIIEVDENVTPFLLKKLNVNMPLVTQAVDKIIESRPRVSGAPLGLSADASTSLIQAQGYLREFGDEFVSIEHLLLGIAEGRDQTSQLLRDSGVSKKELKAAILELRKGKKVTSSTQEETYNALNKYAKNLNKIAQEG
jgi:ATP-dependent Clp protease ATP-binding subunit ClpB